MEEIMLHKNEFEEISKYDGAIEFKDMNGNEKILLAGVIFTNCGYDIPISELQQDDNTQNNN
jgi:hypothetical protein